MLSSGRFLRCCALTAAALPLLAAPSLSNAFDLGSGVLDRAIGTVTGRPQGSAPGAGALPAGEVTAGLKQALRIGAEHVVSRLGRPGGFSDDPAVHIPLPSMLERARRLMKRFGMSGSLDALDASINRAAEEATPKAGAIFAKAIGEMTLRDAQAIYRGPNDAATRYFQRTMTPDLKAAMAPVVDRAMRETGVMRLYDEAMTRYRRLPMAPPVDVNLDGYVLDHTLDGIFHYLAREEEAIRTRPAARVTELLKRLFGR